VHDIFVGWHLARKIDCEACLEYERAVAIPIPPPMENLAGIIPPVSQGLPPDGTPPPTDPRSATAGAVL